MDIIFVISFSIVAYTYFGYPVLLGLAALFLGRRVKEADITPKVTIFISAYNEAKNIEARVYNLLELDYPREKMEIFVGSDGSTDETYQIIKRLADEKGIRYDVSFQRRGKPVMINMMAKEASGDIYVFADARQRFDRNALKELTRCFADPDVGAVSGELIIEDKETGAGEGIGLYWTYEKLLRRMESAIGSMLGATGAIYAVRKEYFIYLPENVLLDDIYTPMNAIMRGKRAILHPAARAYDTVSETTGKEFGRKVRTLVGNFQIFSMFKEAFNVFSSPIAIQLFSHKFLRLVAPYFLVTGFVANVFLIKEGPFYGLALFLQILFYIAAFLGYTLDKSGAALTGFLRKLFIPYEFCALNLAAVVALWNYSRGEINVTWKK